MRICKTRTNILVFDINDLPAKKLFSIIHDKAACIIEIFNGEEVRINNEIIYEMAILHPGDQINTEGQVLKVIDENRLPKVCTSPFKLNIGPPELPRLIEASV